MAKTETTLTERDELAHSFIGVAILTPENQTNPKALVRLAYEFADAIVSARLKSRGN